LASGVVVAARLEQVSWLRQLISRSVYGSRMLSMWLTWPARLKITSRSLHQVVHRALLAHVGDVDAHAVLDARDVEQVAAVVGDERVDEQHVGAEIDERRPGCCR
jgi:hypothetical protein